MPGITRYFVPGLVLGIAGTLAFQQNWCAQQEPVRRGEEQQAVRYEPFGSTDSTCIVTSVTDGDTIRCGEERIRLILADTHERSQGALGDSGTAALRRLIPVGSEARLEFDVERQDRYGRTLAYVWNEHGQLVNEELVRGGYAVMLVYPPNVRYADRIGAAQAEARIYRHGLWAINGFSCTPKAHRSKEC